MGAFRIELGRSTSEVAMKLSYDSRYNIAYIRLAEETSEVEIVRVSEELNV
jgi:hypothetical protein